MKESKIQIAYTEYTYEELPSEYKTLIDNAKEATSRSYAPYSKFNVGASILLENGEFVNGNNQENAAYPSGLCAERVAMFYANAQHPNVAPKAIAVAAFYNGEFLEDPIPPCGSCRQVLLESEERYDKEIEILLYGRNTIYRIGSIRSLLPFAFGKDAL